MSQAANYVRGWGRRKDSCGHESQPPDCCPKSRVTTCGGCSVMKGGSSSSPVLLLCSLPEFCCFPLLAGKTQPALSAEPRFSALYILRLAVAWHTFIYEIKPTLFQKSHSWPVTIFSSIICEAYPWKSKRTSRWLCAKTLYVRTKFCCLHER